VGRDTNEAKKPERTVSGDVAFPAIRPSVQTNLLLLLQNRFAVRLAHSTSEKQQLKLKGGQ
ncbi:unnamed protein product, partial [Musa textilis]